jgi:hypothetical protein
MNESFSADPRCCKTAFELKVLFDKFGIYTGRELVAYPNNWESTLLKHFEKSPDYEQAKVRTFLRRLKEKNGLEERASLIWTDTNSWVDNAKRYLRHEEPRFDGLLVSPVTSRLPPSAYIASEWDPPPTAEESIQSKPEEYDRVCRSLLLRSTELIIVDPYLNPASPYVAPIISRLLETAVKGKCRTVVCWARYSDVINLNKGISPERVERSIREIHSRICIKRRLNFSLNLVDDSRSKYRLHDRYMLNKIGGVEVSQGFVQLKDFRKITVRPISQKLIEELAAVFLSGTHDRNILNRVGLNVVKEIVIK